MKYRRRSTTDSLRALARRTCKRPRSGVSNCHDACAQAWPPLITEGKPQAGTRVQASLLGTMQRQDGTTQVTYNGWPLYYFARDKPQGQPTGHDVQGFGGEWYLIQPQGTKVAEK